MTSYGKLLRLFLFGPIAVFGTATALAQSEEPVSASSLTGRLRIADGGNDQVRGATLLLSREGAVAARAAVSRSGVVHIKALPAGTYSATIVSPGGMAAFGLQVPADASPERFDVLMVPSSDIAAARRHLANAWQHRPAKPAGDSPREAVEPADPLTGDAVAVPRGESISGRLTFADSSMERPLGNADVLFLRNGALAAAARTDADGRYTIASLDEGTYSMVASGEEGFIAAGVEIASDEVTGGSAAVLLDGTEFVNLKKPGSPAFAAMGASADAAPFAPGLAKRASLIGALAAGAAKERGNGRGNAFGHDKEKRNPVSPNGPPFDPPGPPFDPPGPPPNRPPHDPPGPPPGRPPGRP